MSDLNNLTGSGALVALHFLKSLNAGKPLFYLVRPEFSGRCTQREYACVMAAMALVSFVVGPLMGALCLAASKSAPDWIFFLIAFVSWCIQIFGLWVTAGCVVRRCRDGFETVVAPLLALLGFFVAPFIVLAFLGPLLPQGIEDFMQGQSPSGTLALVGSIVLTLVTFGPGLVWLGLRRSQPVVL